jgi:hypothetical protein
MSKHPGPQPPPEISHYDCAGVLNCMQKNRQRGAHWMSDIPGDPGSQLPYQEFSPYHLAPI